MCKKKADSISLSLYIRKQEVHGPRSTPPHRRKTDIAYLQKPCNILPILPQQLGQKFDSGVKKVKGDPRIII